MRRRCWFEPNHELHDSQQMQLLVDPISGFASGKRTLVARAGTGREKLGFELSRVICLEPEHRSGNANSLSSPDGLINHQSSLSVSLGSKS